ncbi:MAG: peptide deformylase [Candidatus Paracaedimonas acanthamoebae]|uniref:Peptide deformylase n=1 Tax=Candidatus Paracaedimonas acanthamoebae TaxID=244581 RepID=A0A8J7TTL3_9PROT|nr:peptide deformylase [Candidatus Paracaedimonas acanthamoebae]
MIQAKKLLSYIAINDENCPQRDILIKPSEEVKFPLSVEDQKIVELLTYQFHHEENCAGLAAPQIGFSRRMVIFSVPEEIKNYRFDVIDTIPETLLINPLYKPLGEETTLDWESCFSVNDYGGEVERFTHIYYEGSDIMGRKVTGEAKGFLARLIQHEIDHINGRLYIHLLKPDARQGKLDEILTLRKAELAAKKTLSNLR